MMTRPRFSVVIPTRNAEVTLGATLKTCLEQEFEDYEIVVSDNSSTTATQELLAGIKSPKIRRVRPEGTLSMQENWEFAVGQAQGEFILVLGSDDGLMLHTLKEADRMLRMLDTKLLRWEAVCYNWPNLPAQEHTTPNRLLVPLKQVDYYHPIRWRDSRQMMLDAANGKVSYAELPTVYASVVHRSLLDTLREQTGKVFHSDCPDVYSGFALAHLVKRYRTLDAPMFIAGLSSVSNGVATIFLKNKSPIAEDFNALNHGRSFGRDWPASIPALPLFCSYTAHSFQCARASLFSEDAGLAIDRRQLAQHAMTEYHPRDEAEWRMLRDIVRQSLADDASLLEWFDAEYAGKSLATCPFAPHPQLKRYGGPYMQLDASEFGVKDVWEAALLCEKLLGYRRDGINAHVKAERIESIAAQQALNGSSKASLAGAPREGLRPQGTEAALLKMLAVKVKRKTFIDVGAEKGSFASELLALGFEGVLVEPVAAHLPALQKLVAGSGSKVLAVAIDAADHEGPLHVDLNEAGEGAPVTCRSLESLAREGLVGPEVGILRVDTEGKNLRALEGMGSMRAEVLMCSYVTPRLYPDWESSFPESLMAAARAMGYEHCIAVNRFDEHEVVERDPLLFADGQWGNLIFTSAAILNAARAELKDLQHHVLLKHVEICQREHQMLLEKEARIQSQALVCLDQQRRLDERKAKIEELRGKVSNLREKNERLRAQR